MGNIPAISDAEYQAMKVIWAADLQVVLLTDFYQNDTIFKPEHVDTLKSTLRLSEKDGAVLSGKTGTGSVNGKAPLYKSHSLY